LREVFLVWAEQQGDLPPAPVKVIIEGVACGAACALTVSAHAGGAEVAVPLIGLLGVPHFTAGDMDYTLVHARMVTSAAAAGVAARRGAGCTARRMTLAEKHRS
jgi:hypothetical protein